jgi:dTDP-4-amino-4,6-dideoxygalactose transaminase
MEAIAEIARGRGLRVVEDACHALGARYRDKGGRWVKAGSCAHSDLSALSFHPVKHITTGEGGAATTNDPDLYERLKIFRNHGITREPGLFQGDGLDRGAGWYYEMLHLGFNYRISDMQAALGSSQLKRLGEFVARRRFIAGHYREAFGANPFFDLPPEREGYESSYHLYPIRIKEPFVPLRRAVFDELRARGIGAQVHYIPVHLQPYYRGLGFEPGLCPAAEGFYSREISLPMFPALRDSDLKKVVRIVLAAFRKVCGPIREGR